MQLKIKALQLQTLTNELLHKISPLTHGKHVIGIQILIIFSKQKKARVNPNMSSRKKKTSN